MQIKTDLHCHTIASTHAYSTVMELAKAAADKNMEAIAITDHCPLLPDAPHPWHFECLDNIPDELYGVRILKGCEANILDLEGNIDLEERILDMLDIVIASVHTPTYKDLDCPDNTEAYMAVLENKYVDILGHSGNPRCRYDIDKVLRRAGELGKLIEINNHTFHLRKKNVAICKEIALKAKKLGVGIAVNSDAHFCGKVGIYDNAIEMLREIDFPEELIMNRSLETLREAFKHRKKF